MPVITEKGGSVTSTILSIFFSYCIDFVLSILQFFPLVFTIFRFPNLKANFYLPI